ncbi:protein of unknown function [Maridesulfovibrio hydrothermalis AM13 = DSM 14728]|uniref:Uncharacterized protein n=1 Tax=Maridesulfovibrio hydrothermalis AM13 = DSM 14728 TaxID=1121451 RepID=L0RF39_9BACT|nr:protein of unknown function [Maridesulfovibrio hydrothermalis AM13 = DSM 14728]
MLITHGLALCPVGGSRIEVIKNKSPVFKCVESFNKSEGVIVEMQEVEILIRSDYKSEPVKLLTAILNCIQQQRFFS